MTEYIVQSRQRGEHRYAADPYGLTTTKRLAKAATFDRREDADRVERELNNGRRVGAWRTDFL